MNLIELVADVVGVPACSRKGLSIITDVGLKQTCDDANDLNSHVSFLSCERPLSERTSWQLDLSAAAEVAIDRGSMMRHPLILH